MASPLLLFTHTASPGLRAQGPQDQEIEQNQEFFDPAAHPDRLCQSSLQLVGGHRGQRVGVHAELRHQRVCPVASAHEEKPAHGFGRLKWWM